MISSLDFLLLFYITPSTIEQLFTTIVLNFQQQTSASTYINLQFKLFAERMGGGLKRDYPRASRTIIILLLLDRSLNSPDSSLSRYSLKEFHCKFLLIIQFI